MPTCSNCLYHVSAGAKFCPFCDAPMDSPNLSTVDASGAVVPVSKQISALNKRYKDAYLVASVTDGFGGLIKGIGVAVAILLLLVGLMFASNGRIGDATFAMGVVAVFFGIFVGIQFYLLGVLVSAQGQILKASLDSAVNSSPFLTNEHKAKIMSLPGA